MSQLMPDLFLKIDTLIAYSLDWKPATDAELRDRLGIKLNPAYWSRYKRGERAVGNGLLRDIVAGALRHLPNARVRLADDVDGDPPLRLPFHFFWFALDQAVRPDYSSSQIEEARERTRGLLRALLLGEGSEDLRGQPATAVDIRAPEPNERWIGAGPAREGLRLPAGGSFTLVIPTREAGAHRLWLYEVDDAKARLLAEGPSPRDEIVHWLESPRLVDAAGGDEAPAIRLPGLEIGRQPGSFTLRAIALPWAAGAVFDEAGLHSAPRKLDFAATALAMLKLKEAVRTSRRYASAAAPMIAHFPYFVR